MRTQLAPSAQTLQVGEASRIRRGSPERVLNSERSWPTSRRSVSCRGPGTPLVVDPAAEVDGDCFGAALLPLLQPAAKRTQREINNASRVGKLYREQTPLLSGVAAEEGNLRKFFTAIHASDTFSSVRI